jgi:hypothetical protein
MLSCLCCRLFLCCIDQQSIDADSDAIILKRTHYREKPSLVTGLSLWTESSLLGTLEVFLKDGPNQPQDSVNFEKYSDRV